MRHFFLFVCMQLSLLVSFAGESINFCKDWKIQEGDAGELFVNNVSLGHKVYIRE